MLKKLTKFFGLGIALFLLIALVVKQGYFMGIQRGIQNRFYDYDSASSEIVVVAIDEKSLSADELGPLQKWPRENYAKAIEVLNREGASVIGIDIAFPDASLHGDLDDQALRDALNKHKNVVLPAKYFFQNGDTLTEFPNPILMEASPDIGWININLDEDGFIRKLPLFNEINGEITEAFSLVASRKYLNAEPVSQAAINGEFRFSKNITIPTISLHDRHRNQDFYFMYVNYFAKPGGFTRISMSDLLKERFVDKGGNPVDFKDKIVLIGPTAIDLGDFYVSPVSRGVKMPGVEIHANNIQTIIEGEFLQDQSRLSFCLVIIGLLMLNLFLFSFLRIRYAVPVALLEMAGILVAGVIAYEFRVILNVVYPILTILLKFIGVFLLRYFLEFKQRKFVESAFGHYVNKEVVDQIIKDPKAMELGGAKREVTVFFSDIAGFTSISEKMEPGGLVDFLNNYLKEMTDVILDHHGTLDKYEGDAIMAFWGAPIPSADHAMQACLAALENQKKLSALRAEWEKQGLPPLHIRIGINTGEAVVGNMGSEDRFDYTVMGDEVNLASRLESIGKQYGTQIIISENTYEQVKEGFICRELDLIRVKGKEKPVRIYELIGAKGEVPAEKLAAIEAFGQALALYRSGKFAEAAEKFQALESDPSAAVFAERCQEFIKTHPPQTGTGFGGLR